VTTVVVAAMPSELKPLTKALGLTPGRRGDVEVREGRLGDEEVVATVIGIGPRSARRSTEKLLDACPADRVVMVGIAGGLAKDLGIGALVVPEACVDGDTGAEVRPTLELKGLTPKGKLHMSSVLIMDPERHAEFEAQGIVALDMETAAVGAVCDERGIPWACVRSISDRPDMGLVDVDMLAMTNADGTPNTRAALKAIARRPWRLPKLLRLAKDSTTAAEASVRAAIAALS
jgi:adenosylhomocysteine nucleosidase